MKITRLLGLLAFAGIFLSSQTVANADTIHYLHTFDGVANDTVSPANQGFTNGAGGAAVPDSATGLISYTSSQGGGFNTTAPLNLSGETEFTVEFVVTSSYAGIESSGLNGSFFGVTSSATSNATNGTALYNNAGSTSGPAIGLQVGPGRGASDGDYAFDNVSGNGSFTALPDVSDDAVDGYTISVTYSDTGTTGETGIEIASTGLATNYSFTTVETGYDFDALAAAVTPNVSAQGGTIDLESIRVLTVAAIPEPSSAIVTLAGTLLLGVRRRRS